jgi:hypothetical protein
MGLDDQVEREAQAIDTVARRILRNAAASDAEPEWGDYPALLEGQWSRVQGRIAGIIDALDPGEESFVAAYEYLTGETP